MKFPRSLIPSFRLAVAGLLLCLAVSAGADEQRVDVLRNGVQTTLLLPQYTSQGVPYASFQDIARQIGASVEVGDATAVLRMGGQAIEVGLEDDEARAGAATIALRHPVRSYNGDALIAIADLVPVLRAGFGFGTPEDPPPGSALSLDPVEPDLESIAPGPDAMESVSLESVEPAAAAAQEPATQAGAEAVARPLNSPAFGDASRFLLAIDPGHGGDDTGVVAPGGLAEKDICLAVAGELRRVLKEQYGVSTVTTRDRDEPHGLKGRRQFLAREKVHLVLSIHSGAGVTDGARGPMLFAHKPAQTLSVDARPAHKVAQTLAGAMSGLSGAGAPPVYEAPLLLLRDSDAPGVLVELGNLKSPEDAARLADAAYQAQLAAALAAGIDQLLERTAAAGGAP